MNRGTQLELTGPLRGSACGARVVSAVRSVLMVRAGEVSSAG